MAVVIVRATLAAICECFFCPTQSPDCRSHGTSRTCSGYGPAGREHPFHALKQQAVPRTHAQDAPFFTGHSDFPFACDPRLLLHFQPCSLLWNIFLARDG